MKHGKAILRKKFILIRKNNYLKKNIFYFHLIFKLIRKHFFKKKISIAGYYTSNHEVDILKLIELATQKKYKIALPVIKSRNSMTFKLWKIKEPLYVNNFGILEPKSSNKQVVPDLILVPLVAFDAKLNRIGYGKGYYDRALRKLIKKEKKIITIGIAYSFQEYKKIPTNKHDFKLHYIFTEQGIINSKN